MSWPRLAIRVCGLGACLVSTCDDGLRPCWSRGHRRRGCWKRHVASGEFKHKARRGCEAVRGICLHAVVIDTQGCDLWDQPHQVLPARVVTLANFLLGNVVATLAHAGLHAGQMPLGTIEPAVPHEQLQPGRGRLQQQRGDGLSTERGLERIVGLAGDSHTQPADAFLPRQAIGIAQCHPGVRAEDAPRFFIGVEVGASRLAQTCPRDAAFARAVSACQYGDARHQCLS